MFLNRPQTKKSKQKIIKTTNKEQRTQLFHKTCLWYVWCCRSPSSVGLEHTGFRFHSLQLESNRNIKFVQKWGGGGTSASCQCNDPLWALKLDNISICKFYRIVLNSVSKGSILFVVLKILFRVENQNGGRKKPISYWSNWLTRHFFHMVGSSKY